MIRIAIVALALLVGCERSANTTPDTSQSNKLAPANSSQSVQPKKLTRDERLETADQLMSQGQAQEAADTLLPILISNPADVEVVFQLANIQASQGKLADAVDLLSGIPEDHPEAGLPAIGQSADWQMALERYEAAEQGYRKILNAVPAASNAHRQLAYLYNRQGRRHEAATHIRELCKLGNIKQDELHALMVIGHAIFNDPNEPAPNDRPYFPIGPAAQARVFYTAGRFQKAVETLDDEVQRPDVKPSVLAFYGLLASEAQDDARFKWWKSAVNESTQNYAEFWAALGADLLGKQEFEPAIRALAEAIDRDPTDANSMRRINQALTAIGENALAEKWMDRYVRQREVTLASNKIGESQTPPLDLYETVCTGLEALDRPLEAVTWRLFQSLQERKSQDALQSLDRVRKKIIASETSFPSQQQRLCGLELETYALPKLDFSSQGSPTLPKQAASTFVATKAVFEDVAESVGLSHTYQVAAEEQPFRFALFQSLGGGAAALDYNRDGWVDVFLAQGGVAPKNGEAKESNLLYSNQDGRFSDVTMVSQLVDRRYSIGVTSGDWNQDGFPDLVVNDIGRKLLLINNGDGTFARTEFDVDPKLEILASSVAMGDVTGDQLPDLVALHYVKDASMLDRPEVGDDGNILTVSPASFVPGVDQITVNGGDGSMKPVLVSDTEKAKSTGLGVVIANWDSKPGNDIFVGNDIRPNHLWVRGDGNTWTDVAPIRGCAYGHGGTSTASMGIAVADFDRNGFQDIHITNFYQESASLFMNREGNFQDRCVQFGIQRDSSSVLGFGCQAIDYDNDSLPDLAVTNGNIEKAPGEPLEQSPQLFANTGKKFALTPVRDSSNYWQGKYLGRGMMRFDFDQDGKEDLLVTHLGKPTALIANRTPNQNHYLTIQLVGVTNERDAVGTKITITAGDLTRSAWLVGGDGYLCRNEATIHFGLGSKTTIDELVVTWPSGTTQAFHDLDTDARVMIVENSSSLFQFDHPSKVNLIEGD